MRAVTGGHQECLAILLAHGADIALADGVGVVMVH